MGEKRKFPSVLIAPNFPALEEWARGRELVFESRAELIASEPVRELYEGIVEEVNQNLARFEKLKKMILVADEFSADNGALTAEHETAAESCRRTVSKPDRRHVRSADKSGPEG